MTGPRTAPAATRAAMAARRYTTLNDETWARLSPLIPDPPRGGLHGGRRGRPSVPNRTVINTLIILARGGGGYCTVSAAPGRLASGMTCWRRVTCWRQQGAWPAITEAVAQLCGVDLTRFDARPGRTPRPKGASAL